jgi:hypothetical protein
MSHNDMFPHRTDKDRAAEYIKRSRPLRPQAPPQTEALFPEPKRRGRRLVPIAPEPAELFAEPDRRDKRLVPVEGWPDYRGAAGGGASVTA